MEEGELTRRGSDRYPWRAEPPGDQELHSDGIHLGGARLLQKSNCRAVHLVLSDSCIP